MKRVQSPLTVRLPPVRLFKEHLEELLKALGEDTELRHAGFSYESFADITKHLEGKVIRDLVIRAGAYDFTTIYIEPGGVAIYGGTEGPEQQALAAQLLRERTPWYSWRPSSSWWYLVRGVLSAVVGLEAGAVVFAYSPFGLAVTVPLAIVSGMVGIAVGSPYRTWLGGSQIHFIESVHQTSFWGRNRDIILVSAISSTVTALLGFLLGALLT